MNIKVGVVDDSQLFRRSLVLLLNEFPEIEVTIEACDGKDLKQKINKAVEPDIILLDVEMPNLNGPETARWLRKEYPSIRLIALSNSEREETILRMIQAGCCTYLLKEIDTEELELALRTVYSKSYFNSELTNGYLGQLITGGGVVFELSEKEKEFLKFATSDHTYKQIALQMKVSERTVDGYRESLFSKFKVQSRTGMVIEAIRRGIVKV